MKMPVQYKEGGKKGRGEEGRCKGRDGGMEGGKVY